MHVYMNHLITCMSTAICKYINDCHFVRFVRNTKHRFNVKEHVFDNDSITITQIDLCALDIRDTNLRKKRLLHWLGTQYQVYTRDWLRTASQQAGYMSCTPSSLWPSSSHRSSTNLRSNKNKNTKMIFYWNTITSFLHVTLICTYVVTRTITRVTPIRYSFQKIVPRYTSFQLHDRFS